ncbi:MAG: archaeosine tRNA-ribosyltransferase [Methanobrevibacter sp.]|jgi:predicted RNA-binding protein|nr:archaeosine tRNA-ribosyltransferase [Candidatus Methanovirga basalitermitum]
MSEKFEIKIHDCSGRLGRLKNLETPNIISEKQYKIAPDIGTAYNIQKEIAIWSVKKTIAKAKKYLDSADIAVVQGAKYIDLRVNTAKELEKIGYNGFLIANGDNLIIHPRDLVDLIVSLRENLNPNSYLIFPFAEPTFIPILSYMGVDLFLEGSGEYYSYLNVLLTSTKNYDLNKYKLFEISQSDLLKKNNKSIEFVLIEVREHMKNGTLRNLVEERSFTSPQNITALKLLDKNHQAYLQKYMQLY